MRDFDSAFDRQFEEMGRAFFRFIKIALVGFVGFGMAATAFILWLLYRVVTHFYG